MFKLYLKANLVTLIIISMIIGILFGTILPHWAEHFDILGNLFVKALLSVAPILVFVLVISSIANFSIDTQETTKQPSKIKPLFLMYIIGMILASIVAIFASMIFPSTLILDIPPEAKQAPPDSVGTVLKNLVLGFFSNPITALAEAKFISILIWAVLLGSGLRHASTQTKQTLSDIANSVNYIIQLVIRLAPIGIFGLVANTIATTGFHGLAQYALLLTVLLGSMAVVALVINPLLVALVTRQNPYPLVLTCLKESGITAFFTRSSAANIPVNLTLAEKLGVHAPLANIAIPLGATINMSGAAITITVLTLAAVHTLGIQTDFITMVILSIVAAVSACGASGVAGGSLLLIPVACSLFGIPPEAAMKVVAVGVLISVLQDSAETALNSSTDVLFAAAIDRSPFLSQKDAP